MVLFNSWNVESSLLTIRFLQYDIQIPIEIEEDGLHVLVTDTDDTYTVANVNRGPFKWTNYLGLGNFSKNFYMHIM